MLQQHLWVREEHCSVMAGRVIRQAKDKDTVRVAQNRSGLPT